MSFIGASNQGKAYAPGWFLKNNEQCTRETRQIAQNHSQVVTDGNGGKHVPMGAFWPANNSSTVKGIVYEDVDVSSGAMPGSVVTKGEVYLDRLPAAPESGVQNALEALGFKFLSTSPAVTRPDGTSVDEMIDLTVVSEAGTASGDTALTVTGHTLGTGESYVYKVGDTAPVIGLKQIADYTWTAWDGTSDITATTDKKIAVAVVDAENRAIAYGAATVTAKP